MSLSHGILGFLSYGNMTGYDLAKVFNSSVNFFWCAQNSHIYLELNKLEKQGYVSCEHIIQSDKPNKKLHQRLLKKIKMHFYLSCFSQGK